MSIGVVLLAVVGSANEGFSKCPTALQASGDSEIVASPILPESVAALTLIPLRPCLPETVGTTADRGGESVVLPRTRAEIERRAVLVAVRVLEKYLDFRESLTSP